MLNSPHFLKQIQGSLEGGYGNWSEVTEGFFPRTLSIIDVLPESTTTLVSSDEPDAIFVNTQAASNWIEGL